MGEKSICQCLCVICKKLDRLAVTQEEMMEYLQSNMQCKCDEGSIDSTQIRKEINKLVDNNKIEK